MAPKKTAGATAPAAKNKKTPVKKTPITGNRKDAEHRMKLFAFEFHHNGGNAKNAAVAAGYSADTAQQKGSDLLSNPKVIAHLQSLSAQSERESIATAIEVHEELTKILRGETETPYVTKLGLVLGPPSASERIKAGSELQKMRGGYAPVRVEHVVQMQVQQWVLQAIQVVQREFKLTEGQALALAEKFPALSLEQVR